MSITPSDTQTPEFYGYEKCPICGEYTKTVGGHWHECRIEGCTSRAFEDGLCVLHEFMAKRIGEESNTNPDRNHASANVPLMLWFLMCALSGWAIGFTAVIFMERFL